MKFKLKKNSIPFILITIGFFLIPYSLRNVLWSEYAPINLLVCIGFMLAINRKLIFSPLFSRKKDDLVFLVFLVSIIILFFYVRGNGWSPINKVKRVFTYIFPILLVYYNIKDFNVYRCFRDVWYRTLRIVCYVMAISWVIDLMLGKFIQHMIVTFLNSSSVALSFTSGRYISLYGHPLESTMIFLAFLMWTLMMSEINRNQFLIIDILVAFLGIAICGSKSGLLLAVILVSVFYFGLNKIKYFLGILVAILLLYFLGVFDLVIERLVNGIQSGDISTTRNYYLIELLGNGTIEFNWLIGHTFIRNIEGMTAALEYPIISFAFTCGILITILLYFAYFIFPTLKIAKTKDLKVLICFLVFIAYLQGNNGISCCNDDMMFYAINCGLLLQVLSFKKGNDYV